VNKAQVKEYWRLCDAALVLLRDLPLFHHVIPSKIFEAWGTGRPVILGVRGESAGIVEAAGGGIVIPPEDPDALAGVIGRLANDRAKTEALGLSGRRHVEREYDREFLAVRMLDLLNEATGHGPVAAESDA
jgi:glycosyltransferase involved in cell wall biosynthesis